MRGVDYYFAVEWQILATGAGLLLVLLVFPGGLGGAFADLRDAVLRRVACRHGLTVPSLLPDEPSDAAAPEVARRCSSRPAATERADRCSRSTTWA